MDEARLLKEARAWDMDALALIYDQYSPALYRYAMRLLGDAYLAEECVAETFSRFLHALRRGGGPRRHLRAYLYRTAHNWITDRYRRRRPEMVALDPQRDVDPAPQPESRALHREEQARVRAALMRLTPAQRQVVVLRFLEGWSLAETAQAVGKPVGAVKALQHRALAALRRTLERDEETLCYDCLLEESSIP